MVTLGGSSLDSVLAHAAIAPRTVLLTPSPGIGSLTDVEMMLSMGQLNITALTELTYRVLPGLLDRGHGAIINVSSVVAMQPVAYMPVYSASKAFVLHFSEALWAEARDRGVTVMALCPGTTETEFFDVAGVPGWLKKQRSQTARQVGNEALDGLEKRRGYLVTYFRPRLTDEEDPP